MSEKIVKSDAEWLEQLTPQQYHVCRQKGTEPAFTGKYNDAKTPGTYNCVCCGQELFRSDTKFDSGNGLAQLLAAPRRGPRCRGTRLLAWNDPYRGAVQPVRGPSRPRFRGRTSADRPALLHELDSSRPATRRGLDITPAGDQAVSMELTDAQIEKYERDGLLVVGGLFTGPEIALLRDEAAVVGTPQRKTPGRECLRKEERLDSPGPMLRNRTPKPGTWLTGCRAYSNPCSSSWASRCTSGTPESSSSWLMSASNGSGIKTSRAGTWTARRTAVFTT